MSSCHIFYNAKLPCYRNEHELCKGTLSEIALHQSHDVMVLNPNNIPGVADLRWLSDTEHFWSGALFDLKVIFKLVYSCLEKFDLARCSLQQHLGLNHSYLDVAVAWMSW
jgi:hypothetical protein